MTAPLIFPAHCDTKIQTAHLALAENSLYNALCGLLWLALRRNTVTGVLSATCLCAQVWLQQFAWTEAEKPGRLADRCEHMTCPASAASLDEEPMFCVETALKALYWSTLVYRYDEMAPDHTRDPEDLKVILRLRGAAACQDMAEA